MDRKNHSGAARTLYIMLGLLCVSLDAVGAALPILPATPFLTCDEEKAL